MTSGEYLKIAEHYDQILAANMGDKYKETDWNNPEAADRRYHKFAETISNNTKFQDRILDFGAGTGSLLDYMYFSDRSYYTGMDISSNMINEAQRRFPDVRFICQDILTKPLEEQFSVIIVNGVFTIKKDLHWTEMVKFTKDILAELWKNTDSMLCFNFMDWNRIPAASQRADLFFLTYDTLFTHLIAPLEPKNWIIDCSYGCYDSLAILYKK
jgi:SAM-dependent methyltransferase